MIRVTQEGRVRRVTLAAAAEKNVLNGASGRALLDALADSADTSVILIDAEGPMFCGGVDFADPPPDELFAARSTTPVIVSMQGVALSGGVALLATAHIVIAAQGSSFGLTDIREGRWHGRVLQVTGQVLGARRARELAITGRVFTVPDALNWGLVHAAVPAFELDDRATAVARGVAGASAEAIRAVLTCYA
jgi:enoyl-CoA hydratase/carnithine racemase